MGHTDLSLSPWIVRHADLVPAGPVLDLACGGGRHIVLLVDRGHPVTAVDRDVDQARSLGHDVELIEADLERGPWPLPDRAFAGVVVCNYLWRPLWPQILSAVSDPGVLIYETFAEGNERYGRPRNPDHLLRAGELLEVVEGAGMTVLAYEHGLVEEAVGDGPARPTIKQRICALRGEPPGR